MNHLSVEGFDVASYTNKMVDMFTSESSKEVTLLCENELMRVIIDHYGEDAPVERYGITRQAADKRLKKIEEKIKKLVAIF